MKLKKYIVTLCAAIVVFGLTKVNVSAQEMTPSQSDNGARQTEALQSIETTIEEILSSKETVKEEEIATFSVQQRATVKASYTKEDLRILTAIMYCEAGGQSEKSLLAVGNVINNRVKSNQFDHVNSIKEAVYDLKRWGRQFSPAYVKTSNGSYTTKGSRLEKALKMYTYNEYKASWEKKQMQQCEAAAIKVLEGNNNIGSYLYFNANVIQTKAICKANGKPYRVIDSQIFY